MLFFGGGELRMELAHLVRRPGGHRRPLPAARADDHPVHSRLNGRPRAPSRHCASLASKPEGIVKAATDLFPSAPAGPRSRSLLSFFPDACFGALPALPP